MTIAFDKIRSGFSLENFAVLILVLFCIQYIPLESYTISVVKVAASVLCLFVFLIKDLTFSKAVLLSVFFALSTFLSAISHPESFRISTLLYMVSFLVTFITMYNLVHFHEVLSLKRFTKILRILIYAFAIVLLVQQFCVIVGIRHFPLINMTYFLNRGIGANSLCIEPSHSARIMGALFYSYIQSVSFGQSFKLKLRQLFAKEHRWVSIGFLWSMLTMGSGTAFIVLGIMCLYFINWRNVIITVPLIVCLVSVASRMGIEQFDRAYSTVQATVTLDADAVRKTDGSASYRIVPILNTIMNFDITNPDHWFGYGTDSGKNDVQGRMIFQDYGFLNYIMSLVLVFTCCINFFSIPTIMFFLGVGGGTGNIAYGWGILMVFMCLRYFHDKYVMEELTTEGEGENSEEATKEE